MPEPPFDTEDYWLGADPREVVDQRQSCHSYRVGIECRLCNHEHCGWCPECHPEVPD